MPVPCAPLGAMRNAVLLPVFVLCACADTSSFTVADTGGDLRADLGLPDAAESDLVIKYDVRMPETAVVYAHSDQELFRIVPDSLKVSPVGLFGWPGDEDKMTDIALDQQGRMIGVSKDRVYSVDPATAECQLLAGLTGHFVGLSFIAAETSGEPERLLGISQDSGEVYEIDPSSGEATRVGAFGQGFKASGDLVSVRGLGTVATVIDPDDDTDWLVSLDPDTGEATRLGDTGFAKIWGLGFWGDKLYGFTDNKEFLLIDATSGQAQLEQQGLASWWGAGVRTTAPVIN